MVWCWLESGLGLLRSLADPDGREDEGCAEELGRAEGLVQHDETGGGGNDWARQAEQRDLGDGESGDASKPDQVGDRCAASGQPGESDEVLAGHGWWRAFDGERDRGKEEPAGDELPAGERRKRNRAAPVLGEYDAGGHADSSGEAGDDADGIELRAGAQHEKSDADDAEGAGDGGGAAEPFAEHRSGESGGDEGLDRTERGGDTAGQAVRGDEQQHEERPDVQHPEHCGFPPPRTGRTPSSEGGQSQTGWQGSKCCGQQGTARRQQFGGDDVGEPPRSRGEPGDERIQAPTRPCRFRSRGRWELVDECGGHGIPPRLDALSGGRPFGHGLVCETVEFGVIETDDVTVVSDRRLTDAEAAVGGVDAHVGEPGAHHGCPVGPTTTSRTGRGDEHPQMGEGGGVDSGDPVDGVLQQGAEAAVVLRRHDDESVGAGDSFGQRSGRSRHTVACFEITVVERHRILTKVHEVGCCRCVQVIGDLASECLVDRSGTGAGCHDQDRAVGVASGAHCFLWCCRERVSHSQKYLLGKTLSSMRKMMLAVKTLAGKILVWT